MAVGRRLSRIGGVAALVVVAVVAFRGFVGEPFTVSAMSMAPTLTDGDRIFVNKVPYHVRPPQRGDVIVIDGPALAGVNGWSWPERGNRLVKRVVALPGRTVEGRDGMLWIDGRPVAEPYLPAGQGTPAFPAVEIPEDAVFVLGDNRDASIDSRTFGPVPHSAVVGRADAVLWPPSSVGRL